MNRLAHLFLTLIFLIVFTGPALADDAGKEWFTDQFWKYKPTRSNVFHRVGCSVKEPLIKQLWWIIPHQGRLKNQNFKNGPLFFYKAAPLFSVFRRFPEKGRRYPSGRQFPAGPGAHQQV